MAAAPADDIDRFTALQAALENAEAALVRATQTVDERTAQRDELLALTPPLAGAQQARLRDLNGNGAGSIAEAEAERAAAELRRDAARAPVDATGLVAETEERVDGNRDVMRELCTGRIPQQPVIRSGRIDPESVLGAWPVAGASFPPEYYKCPPNTPLFTTTAVLRAGTGFNRNGKRYRAEEYEECIPVIAHIPPRSRLATFGNSASKLVFVGISYGTVSKNNVIAMVGKGSMPVPHELVKSNFYRMIGKKVVWKRSSRRYGSKDGPIIAVPTNANDDARANPAINQPAANDHRFIFHATNRVGNIVVQSADVYDCALLIG